jgi:hypothetical protein
MTVDTANVGTKLRSGEIRVYNTHVAAWEATPNQGALTRVMLGVLGRLRRRGWSVERDPDVIKHYPTLVRWHYVGSKGDLRLVAQASGCMMSVEFHQDVNATHPRGGRYGSYKFAAMPRYLRLACVVEMNAVIRKLRATGYGGHGLATLGDVLLRAEDRHPGETPLEEFNRHWNGEYEKRRGEHRFERDATGWPALSQYTNYNNDRDGRQLINGQVKYFRYRGSLQRSVIYTNMNSMWRVEAGSGTTYVSGSQLFDCEHPEVERHVIDKKRQRERLRTELDKAVKAENYARAATLASVLVRVA